MKQIKTLIPRYKTPLLSKYGGQLHHHLKNGNNIFSDWLNAVYNLEYKDIKEGDIFLAWNGTSVPVPFVQLKDEQPDKRNRPTRLKDGSYYGLEATHMVCLIDKEIAASIKKEVSQFLTTKA